MARSKIEAVARAICVGAEENPDHVGDASGNEFRWQDYLTVAEKALEAAAEFDKKAESMFPPIEFDKVAPGIEVGEDLFGGADIRLGGEFVYVRVNYQYGYTDNISRNKLVKDIVELLSGGRVVSCSRFQELTEMEQLKNAINMGLPIWPTKWSQDVAALAFFIHGLKEKAPNEAHGTPEYKDFVQLAHQQGLMPWYDIN